MVVLSNHFCCFFDLFLFSDEFFNLFVLKMSALEKIKWKENCTFLTMYMT